MERFDEMEEHIGMINQNQQRYQQQCKDAINLLIKDIKQECEGIPDDEIEQYVDRITQYLNISDDGQLMASQEDIVNIIATFIDPSYNYFGLEENVQLPQLTEQEQEQLKQIKK